ncbi:MAG: sigma-E processing peptidase SpoIIGA [Clostridiales bacterium]|nr:sigma-E processing peptidase SpoIIGA [Clostridiales bacterium]
MIIYVDVLFVINFFITYLLLLLTCLITKQSKKQIRLLFASALGGLYSLVILADSLSFLITAVGKLIVSIFIVLIAFGFVRISLFIKNTVIFYFSNLIFLGVITAVCYISDVRGITVNNSTVYFDISASTLLLSAGAAYILSVIIIKLHNRTLGKAEIYSLTIFKNEQQIHMFAFLDSGNKLKEPFSDYPVVIVDESKITFETERMIPYNTVAGEGVLRAFKPDKIIISNGKKSLETDRVYVAVSSVDDKNFSAILNSEILNI